MSADLTKRVRQIRRRVRAIRRILRGRAIPSVRRRVHVLSLLEELLELAGGEAR